MKHPSIILIMIIHIFDIGSHKQSSGWSNWEISSRKPIEIIVNMEIPDKEQWRGGFLTSKKSIPIPVNSEKKALCVTPRRSIVYSQEISSYYIEFGKGPFVALGSIVCPWNQTSSKSDHSFGIYCKFQKSVPKFNELICKFSLFEHIYKISAKSDNRFWI